MSHYIKILSNKKQKAEKFGMHFYLTLFNVN